MDATAKNILLTGVPGCGKTTVILHLVGRVGGLRLAGFHTQELRERGQRVGFEAVGLSSAIRCVLAHTSSRSRIRVGRYGVETVRFASLVQAELKEPRGEIHAYIIDEIGKMELHTDSFVRAIRSLLDGPARVIATVALKGGGVIAEVKARPDVELIKVTRENRDQLAEMLADWLRLHELPKR